MLLRAARNTSLVGKAGVGGEEDHEEDRWLQDNEVMDSNVLARMKAREQEREAQEDSRREKGDLNLLKEHLLSPATKHNKNVSSDFTTKLFIIAPTSQDKAIAASFAVFAVCSNTIIFKEESNFWIKSLTLLTFLFVSKFFIYILW